MVDTPERFSPLTKLKSLALETFQVSDLMPNPTPCERMLIALREATRAAELIANDRGQLENIRATLYVNFVARETNSINICKEDFDRLEATRGLNGCLVAILEKYYIELERLRIKQNV